MDALRLQIGDTLPEMVCLFGGDGVLDGLDRHSRIRGACQQPFFFNPALVCLVLVCHPRKLDFIIRRGLWPCRAFENGSAKVGHGSGVIISLRAA
ncbi:hypothetical protein MCRY_12080 [Marivita cryptomonadis]|nr:hypothetical protein MCRY_12080 [Marivita cryptomonadis]